MTYQTIQVFGVSNETIATYVTREAVDNLFIEGLKKRKHIVIYGASKQGKTSLTNKHLTAGEYIRVNCSPNSTSIDLYKSILRQLNIEFIESKEEENTLGFEGIISANIDVKIPLISDIGGEASIGGKKENVITTKYETIKYNLALAQDVYEVLKKSGFHRRIILENFHYLNENVQRQLAFDLRVFEDNNILFIIVGIWRERNRLSQFNGDLLDRMIEIPVEPWEKHDLIKIIDEGTPLLNVSFEEITEEMINSCFDSVGVFQELCKEVCIVGGVNETPSEQVVLKKEFLRLAIQKKLEDYSNRHIRSIESFVQQEKKSSDEIPLYMRYYFIKVLFSSAFDDVTDGLGRKDIHEEIKKIHHRGEDVRSSDMGNLLKNLVSDQIKRHITPPIFDFDSSTSKVKIIDSTFYFFLKNCNKQDVLDDLPMPTLE